MRASHRAVAWKSNRLRIGAAPLVCLALCITTATIARAQLSVPPGWYSGDVHVHWPDNQCGGVASPEAILAAMPAELNIASVLIWCGGGSFEEDAEAYFAGKTDNAVSTPDQIVHYDLEVSACNLADRLGHVNYLYLDEINFPPSTYHGPIQDWAHAQGGVVGFDHAQGFAGGYDEFPSLLGCCRPYEAPVDVALGRVDYLTYQPTNYNWRFLWYTLLDCGFRPGLTASTDSFCLPFTVGRMRTYVPIDAPDYGDFVAALAAGRVVAVEDNANFIEFQVNGADLGDEVQLATPGDPVTLSGALTLPAGEASQGTLEIVCNQEVVFSLPYAQAGGTIPFSTTHTPTKSSWYAARTEASHTGAIFLEVAGLPIRASFLSANYYVLYMDWLTDLVESGFFDQLTHSDKAAFLADISQAKVIFEQIRLQTMGPTSVAAAGAPPVVVMGSRPNPFTTDTRISIDVTRAMPLAVEIFSADGRWLRRLDQRMAERGLETFRWDGRDTGGERVGAGVYLYRVTANGRAVTSGKLVRVR